jgi:hypothetical protein
MSKAFSPIGVQPSPGSLVLAAPLPWRLDLSGLDGELARIFDAIRDYARIAWWDGSAIGLQLNGVLGLFDPLETDLDSDRGDSL